MTVRNLTIAASLIGWLVWPGFAISVDGLTNAGSELVIESLEYPGVSLEGIEWHIDHARTGGPALRFRVERVRIAATETVLADVRVLCDETRVSTRGFECENLLLHADVADKNYAAIGDLVYNWPAKQLTGSVAPAEHPDTRAFFSIDLSGPATSASLRVEQMPLSQMQPLVPGYEFYSGLADLEVGYNVSGNGGFAIEASVSDVSFSNASGTVAAEALSLSGSADFVPSGAQVYSGQVGMSVSAGAIYAEPYYVDFNLGDLTLVATPNVNLNTRTWRASEFDVEHEGVFRASGELSYALESGIQNLEVEVEELRFPALYESWIAGLAVGTPLASLETSGGGTASFRMSDGQAQAATLSLAQVDIEDRAGRFAFYGMNTELNWAADGNQLSSSVVAVDGGYIYGANFAATSLELGIAGEAVDLLEPVRIEALGGALAVNTFALRDYGGDDLKLRFEAALEPIDLAQLTLALDWPAFAGTLSGQLPLMRYEDGVVSVGGNLEAAAFDGAISVEGLTVRQPFGLVPEILATIRLRNLDLEQVTQVVPFGRVSGRLDGDIEGLHLLKGEPIKFNANFRTPKDDRSKHRLSQRAVDTISRVAGGGAALSTTFLRVFKHFAYEKLGISCRLEDDICHMNGVEAADDGYYIVKGALIPRVDLIGRVKQVQWSRLMQQLERALNEGEIKIE